MKRLECELFCEIRHGGELSFEDLGAQEDEIRAGVEDILASMAPAYVDFRVMGDDFGFVSSLRDAQLEELRKLCWELASLVDPGARGRLVAVESGFGPVRIWSFSAQGVDETLACAEPGGGPA